MVMEEQTTRSRSDRLATLYEAEAPGARRFAYLLTGDATLAEDLVQDAFVKVGGRLGAVRDPERFGAYLRSTVVNLSRNQFRRNAVARKHLAREAALPRRSDEAVDVETRDEVWRALQALPARQREVLVCRFYMDLSERETAELLRCPPGTVKSAAARGLETLRSSLGVDR